MEIAKKRGASIALFLFLTASGFCAHAQKVKYKDLIVLLNAKQYDKSEPFLRRYLRENTDNPNAYLNMGIVLQDKAQKMDPLLSTPAMVASLDSAQIFYDKAAKMITDRELRKNDEYYEAYMRRDLRTGKFVIKLSDVQLDIENRMKACGERSSRVKQLKTHFDDMVHAYERTQAAYKLLLTGRDSEKDLYLTADQSTVKTLKSLTLVFDSVLLAYDQYKVVSKELGKTGHNQVIDLKEIKDLKQDGLTTAEFLKDDLKLWNYRRWSDHSAEVIEKEIVPMREKLVAFDVSLNKLGTKLKTDSVSVKADVRQLAEKMNVAELKKFDHDPMPMALFAMKIADLDYRSDLISNKHTHDSAQLKPKVAALTQELADLKLLDSLATGLNGRNWDTEEKYYQHFIAHAFGSIAVLKNTVTATQEFARRERAKKESAWKQIDELRKWQLNGADSIPLVADVSGDRPIKPLLIEPDKYTAGLTYVDSLATGYFYEITPSHMGGFKATFPVSQENFKRREFTLINALGSADEQLSTFYILIFSTQKTDDKFPATVAKIQRKEGLIWSANLSFSLMPSEILINPASGGCAVKSLASDGAAQLVQLDKSGRLQK